MICFITIGTFYSCDKDDNLTGDTYMTGGYRDGKYGGNKLNFLIDELLTDVSVDVKTTENMMIFVVNSPSYSSSLTLTAHYYEDASGCGYSPDSFVGVNGKTYKFDFSFDKEGVLSISCSAVSD